MHTATAHKFHAHTWLACLDLTVTDLPQYGGGVHSSSGTIYEFVGSDFTSCSAYVRCRGKRPSPPPLHTTSSPSPLGTAVATAALEFAGLYTSVHLNPRRQRLTHRPRSPLCTAYGGGDDGALSTRAATVHNTMHTNGPLAPIPHHTHTHAYTHTHNTHSFS